MLNSTQLKIALIIKPTFFFSGLAFRNKAFNKARAFFCNSGLKREQIQKIKEQMSRKITFKLISFYTTAGR